MKLSAAILISFLGSALAAGPADGVNAVLNDITAAIKAFDTSIKAYTGGPNVDALNKASAKVEQTTTSGAKTIAAGGALTLNDAVSITSTVTGLQSALDTALGDLEGIGPKLVEAGQCSSIQAQLASQNTGAKALEGAITDKTPNEAKSIAKQLGGQVGASISKTQSKFTALCANAPKGAPAPAGGAAPAPAASAAKSSTPVAATTAKASTTSAGAKPATYTGSANILQGSQALALGVAAAFLAL